MGTSVVSGHEGPLLPGAEGLPDELPYFNPSGVSTKEQEKERTIPVRHKLDKNLMFSFAMT